ncbi:MAG TPA: cytochrome c3 family protein [Polyangiaceae bacterium]|nr:cytochrome c3 family protein [Polyangiaceae bacterium]
MKDELRGAHWLWSVVLIVAIVGACVRARTARFPHRPHVAEGTCQTQCLTCTSCHAHATEGKPTGGTAGVKGALAHAALPEASLCETCHHDEPKKLATRVAPPTPDETPIRFDHDRHLAMPGIAGQCVGCHAGVVESGKPNLPPMTQCFSCHEHEQQWQRAQCAPCHADRELRSLIPRSFLPHDQAFARRHGQAANQQMSLCRSCHAPADCEACHDTAQELPIERRLPEKVERRFVHRGDYLTVHGIEASSQPSRCLRCHEVQTCDSCHSARGVSAGLMAGRNPHPPGWVGANTQSFGFHGREARRNILSCAGCHDQGPATNCIRCHRVGGYGGNPHPAGRWPGADPASETMCRYCHE